MYFITATHPVNDTSWVYLHPVDGRFQLSPFAEPVESLTDARRALDLALDWFGDYTGWTVEFRGHGRYSSHYSGPAVART